MKRITITIDDDDTIDYERTNMTPPFWRQTPATSQPWPTTAPSWTPANDSVWENGVDICATCPNRPGGPLNKSGICMCAIPAMYGPQRVTC